MRDHFKKGEYIADLRAARRWAQKCRAAEVEEEDSNNSVVVEEYMRERICEEEGISGGGGVGIVV